MKTRMHLHYGLAPHELAELARFDAIAADEHAKADEIAERQERERVRRMICQRRAFKLALQRVTFRTHGKRTV